MSLRKPIYVLIAATGSCLAATSVYAAGLDFDPAASEAATGFKGVPNEAEGVFKVSAPRKDIAVTVEGWTLPPFMGLTS